MKTEENEKKIIFVVNSVRSGGAGRVVALLADAMAKNHDVKIVLMDDEKDDYYGYLSNKRVRLIPLFKDQSSKTKNGFEKIRRLRTIVCENVPDSIIAFTTLYAEYTILATLGLHCKVVVSERVDPAKYPTKKVLRALRNPLYMFSDGIVMQTDDMLHYFPSSIQRKSQVILNPINPQIVNFKTDHREPKIVSVGRLDKQKNYNIAINAFEAFSAEFPDYIYEIYGDGPLEIELKKMISDRGLEGKVVLKGHVSNVYENINSAAMFIMSSDYEGLSNALMEAMALGLPCVSTDHPIGGARMLIANNVNGILVPVNDADSLAEAMKKIAKDKAFSEQLGKRAASIIETCNIDNIVASWLKFCGI